MLGDWGVDTGGPVGGPCEGFCPSAGKDNKRVRARNSTVFAMVESCASECGRIGTGPNLTNDTEERVKSHLSRYRNSGWMSWKACRVVRPDLVKAAADYQEVTTEITRLQGMRAERAISDAIEFYPKSFQYPAKKESRLLTGGLVN
jgi:hypothetical protein